MNGYFVGHKAYKIDSKGRISIPANMRASLGQEFIASRGVGKCLALYPMEEWHNFMQKIIDTVSVKERKILELHFAANAEKMSLDGQGRLFLNENLRKQVNLENETMAEVFGNSKRIEIWNCDLFNAMFEGYDEKDVEDILDKYDI